MKTLRKTALFLLLIFLILPELLFAWSGKVVSVHDGNTLKAAGHDIEIMVRLAGIDAPEISKKKHLPGQPYSVMARAYLAKLVLNKTVDIKGYGLDRYHRILGVVVVDGRNVNLELVKAGLAEVYRGNPPKGLDLEPYQQAEAEAKKAIRGMWSLRDQHFSPMDWRQMHRK
jgi:endonuclease YncB( thermonuclease family)